jgi:hypothetical protein
MGWVDNIDSELSANADVSDDQPGPSNVTTTPVIVISPADAAVNDEGNEISSPTETQDKTEKENSVSPYKEFAEKVTIAGLPEAYGAQFKPDKIMFRAALILAFICIIYESIAIAKQYKNGDLVMTDIENLTLEAPFPNISVCFPFFFNRTVMDSWFSSKVTLKIKNGMKRHNYTKNDIVKFLEDGISRNLKTEDLGDSLSRLSFAVYDAVTEDAQNLGLNPVLMMVDPGCSNILTNCFYRDREFDCCQNAQFFTFWISSCFQISVSYVSLFRENQL